jgi:hypothetical protein
MAGVTHHQQSMTTGSRLAINDESSLTIIMTGPRAEPAAIIDPLAKLSLFMDGHQRCSILAWQWAVQGP